MTLFNCRNGMMLGETPWSSFKAETPEKAAQAYAEMFPDEEPTGIFRVNVKLYGRHDSEYEPYQVRLPNVEDPFTGDKNEDYTVRKL